MQKASTLFTRALSRLAIAGAALALALVGVQAVGQPAAHAEPSVQQTTVYYTAYAYGSQANQAAAIWNNAAPNLNMVASSYGSIRIYATTGGGSRAYVCGLGCATIYIDYYDVAAGNSPLRIVAHEIGHGLGLPDTYNGICSYLMSGGSAGTSCTNPYPNYYEAAQVNNNFGFALDSTVEPFISGVYDPSRVGAGV